MTQHASSGHGFQIDVESPEPWQRIIKVSMTRPAFEQEYQRRLTEAVRNHKRPGFRKGKTPRPVVERELGSRLRADTFEGLVPRAYRAAVVEHGLYPLTDPRVENLKFEEGQDLGFDLVVEVRPEVTAHDYENLPVRERAAEVAESEVDEMIARLQESRAYFEKAERPAAATDQVVMDLVPVDEDGTAQEDKRLVGQSIILDSEQNLPAFNEGLFGASAGDERTVTATYPDDYPNTAMQGRTVAFRCHVTEVRARTVPTVDDAFASSLQEGQTLAELRDTVREKLEEEARRRIAQEMDEQVLEALVERNEVPVPPSMVADYLEMGIKELHERNTKMGRESSDDEDQKYREAARPMAERVIKGLFLLEAVRGQENLEATDQEIDDRIAVHAAENGFDLEKFRDYVNRGEERERIRREVNERKAYDLLLARAQIVHEEPGAGQADAADGATG